MNRSELLLESKFDQMFLLFLKKWKKKKFFTFFKSHLPFFGIKTEKRRKRRLELVHTEYKSKVNVIEVTRHVLIKDNKIMSSGESKA